MLCVDFDITYCSNPELLDNYISDYTDLFYKFYNHFDKAENNEYIQYVLNNYHLDKSIFDSCIKDVTTKLKQRETEIKKKNERIQKIEDLLKEDNFKTKKEKRSKFKLIKKLAELKRNINKNCVFGGKSLLREITKLSQTRNKTEEQIQLLQVKKQLFKERRKLPIYIEGRACENGNRKVDFDFNNLKAVLKFSKQDRININLKLKSNEKKKLILIQKLQYLSDTKQIPLTVRITKYKLYVFYDENIVSGFKFNEINCKREQSLHTDPDVKKFIYIKYCKELDSRKLVGKKENRFMSVDLNPYFIGISIFDFVNNEQKIIHLEAIDLTKLKPIKDLASSNKKQKRRNNKRKHEIKEVWKYIFNLVKHYKVFNFIYEELDFKLSEIKKNKELNKQTKNLWHRTLTENLILKYCNIIGLKLIQVNPCYSSFIGNMIYPYFDPISSSLEIGRRGCVKYKKGSSIYPELSKINQEKLNYLLGENIEVLGNETWISIYRRINLTRYRNGLNSSLLIAKNLYCVQSKTIRHNCICF